MGLTSRKKVLIGERKNLNRDASLIVIATEGRETEKIYFESFCFKSSRVHLKVLPSSDNKSAPNHVHSRIKEFCNNLQLKEDKDQFWIVLDKDRWKEVNLTLIQSEIRRIKRYNLRLAISNPCFEIWLYLHICDINSRLSNCKAAERMLRKELGVYNKSNPDMSIFCPRVDAAINRAENLDTNKKSPWPLNPGSRIYMLIKEIKNL